MTDFSKIFANFMAAGFKGAVGNALKEKGIPCGIKDCKNFSVGLYCDDCCKALCGDHIYFKPSVKELKPTSICPGCIADNHPEIFDVETY